MPKSLDTYDVAIIGAGIAGMSVAARLQAKGLSTLVLEAHGTVGGCAGYYRRGGFSFDVGATTLVDFHGDGVGAELLASIGMTSSHLEQLPGYVAWLPDRSVVLPRNADNWQRQRLAAFGNSGAHTALWDLFDRLATAFWGAARRGVRLPMRNLADLTSNILALGFGKLPLVRYLNWTLEDALRAYGLERDQPLRCLLAMLVEDTVHARLDQAPLINSVLGASIRSAGLSRARGGMRGFWEAFTQHYAMLGGRLRVGQMVERIHGKVGAFTLETRRGHYSARNIVSALPVQLTARLGLEPLSEALAPYLRPERCPLGGAMVVCLGVPEEEVGEHALTHHQLLLDYDAPLGEGNNMFVSVSSPGDTESAPPGERAVMLSTHCELEPWRGLTETEYEARKAELGARLIRLAQRVYPRLGTNARVVEVGTPRTYERFLRRPNGSVGGFRTIASNTNQNAVPYDVGVPGVWLCGDTTWPGLGTVACVLASRHVATAVAGQTRVTSKHNSAQSFRVTTHAS